MIKNAFRHPLLCLTFVCSLIPQASANARLAAPPVYYELEEQMRLPGMWAGVPRSLQLALTDEERKKYKELLDHLKTDNGSQSSKVKELKERAINTAPVDDGTMQKKEQIIKQFDEQQKLDALKRIE